MITIPLQYLKLLSQLKVVKDLPELDKYIVELPKLLHMDQIIIYKDLKDGTIEVISIYSEMENEKLKVDSIIKIDTNINIQKTIKTGKQSTIPVPDVGADIAIPINKEYILTADDTTVAQTTDRIKHTLLSLVANAINGILEYRNLFLESITDPLTQALNQGALDKYIRSTLDPFGQSHKNHVGIIFIDIDLFGLFNRNIATKRGMRSSNKFLKNLRKLLVTIVLFTATAVRKLLSYITQIK